MLNFTRMSLLSFAIVFSLSVNVKAQTPVVINEFMASNNSIEPDPQGEYDDWIEIYNPGTSLVNIGGLYLTDDLSVPNKWQFPDPTVVSPGGYLLVWADGDVDDDGLHANFKLSANGEEIGLFEADGSTLIDSVTYGEQTTDVSYGRYPDAGNDWNFLSIPTPETWNEGAYAGEVEAPEFSYSRGFYDEPFTLTITTETEGASIFYTIDGSSPYDSERNVARGIYYTGPVSIMTTTCLRAIAIKSGWKNSEIITHTYIFLDDVIRQPENPEGFPGRWGNRNADYEMDSRVVDDPAYSSEIKDDLKSTPSVSIVIPVEDFFGSEGIYANPTLYADDWELAERAASIEWIDPNTGEHFGVNAGLRIHGGPYSRSGNPKNAMRIIFRSEYGPSRLEYPLFPDTDVETFNTLVLRSIWNYSWTGHSGMSGSEHAEYLRDAFARDTIRDMGHLAPHGRGVQVYINGLYWGMYIMTERPDERFVADHIGGDEENYDVLEAPSGYGSSTIMQITSGGEQARQAWESVFALSDTNLSTSQAYEAMQASVDIPAMIDYMLMIYYVGSRDAPVFLGDSYTPRNFYVARLREPASPFLIIPWDTEWALEEPTVNRVNVVGVMNPHYLINRLRQNSDFRILLADHIHKQFFNGGALTREQTTQRYMDRVNEIYGAIVGESARWGDEPRSWRPYTRDVEWLGEVDRLVNEYFFDRTEIVMDQLRNAGFYPSVSAPEFYVNGWSQYGGLIDSDDVISIGEAGGTIWYTLDGTDPRLPGTTADAGEQITLVTENSPRRVLVPTGPIGDAWNSGALFNDSSWISGTGGVGYEAGSGYEHLININLYGQMYQNVTGCYIRIPFDVEYDPSNLGTMTLRVRYDDGFVAYINGAEVARSNAPESLQWDSSATNIHDDNAAVIFQDFNISSYMDELRRGENILAIHGLNAGLTSSDFLISPELTVGESAPVTDLGVSSNAIEYTGSITLTNSTRIKARAISGNTWSALSDATFAVGPVAENLRITEIMYHPFDVTQGQTQDANDIEDPNEEFIELKNIGTETINLNLVSFTNGVDFTFPNIELAGGEYIVVVENRNAFEARYGTNINVAGEYTGRLNNGGERVTLEDAAGQIILNFRYRDGWYDTTDGEGFSLTVMEPSTADPNEWNNKSGWRPSVDVGGSPGWDDTDQIPRIGEIVINELLAHSHAEAPDWIELRNPTDASINISGWFISDSDADLMRYEIADGTIIEPDGYVVFYEDINFGNSSDPGCYVPFALSESGETLYLSSGQNGILTGYNDQERFDASETGVAFGRYRKSTGTYNFVSMSLNTPGSENAYPKVGPIVINEIMYNPASGDQDEEYIELLNISDSAVTLTEFDDIQLIDVPWQLTDSNGIVFDFPLGTTMAPGEYLLLVKDENAFNLRYPNILRNAQIIEWGDGRLSNAGERVQLSKPGEQIDDTRYYIRVDRVNYSDGSHPDDEDLWPVGPDGNGYSLTRRDAYDYGNDVDNWQAATPSPCE